MIAAQIHLQCVSIKPSSDIWSLSVIINNDIVIIIITTIRIIITNINLKNYSSCQSNNSSQSFSNYNLKVTVREEFDTPTTQDIRQWRLFLTSQLRRSKDARRCFSGSENDWKRMIRSLENPGVYENPCGDLMLPALAHSLCVDVILFNTRRTSAPIYPVSSTVLGGQPSS